MVNPVDAASYIPEEGGSNSFYNKGFTKILSVLADQGVYGPEGLTSDSTLDIVEDLQSIVLDYKDSGATKAQVDNLQGFVSAMPLEKGTQQLQSIGAMINYAAQLNPNLTPRQKVSIQNTFDNQLQGQSGDAALQGFMSLQMAASLPYETPENAAKVDYTFNTYVKNQSGEALVSGMNQLAAFLYAYTWSKD